MFKIKFSLIFLFLFSITQAVSADVVEPLRCQYTVGVLSEPVWMVRSRKSNALTRISFWATDAASSRSELVTVPVGLSHETRAAWMCGGKGERHRIGACTSNVASREAGGGAVGGSVAGEVAHPRTKLGGSRRLRGEGGGVTKNRAGGSRG